MSRTRSSEAGFTLAGLIVIMTVIVVMIAYTVPKQWSIAASRAREQQTLFAMRQYARAIQAYQDTTHVQPTSLEQLKQKGTRRFLRGKGEYIDPLTGKVDWIPVAMSNPAAQQQRQQGGAIAVPGVVPPQPTGVPVGTTPVNPQPQTTNSAGQPGGFVGPFIGVRPNKTGPSYLVVNGQDNYDQWSYTTVDLANEIAQHRNSIMVK